MLACDKLIWLRRMRRPQNPVLMTSDVLLHQQIRELAVLASGCGISCSSAEAPKCTAQSGT